MGGERLIMAKDFYGDPILTLRLPPWQLIGLKNLAVKQNTTASAILRDLILAYLTTNGITPDHGQPLDGQCALVFPVNE